MENVVEFRVEESQLADNVSLLTVEGELDLYTAPAVRRKLLDLPAEVTWVVVDLVRVGFLDSTGLSVLTSGARRLRFAGGGIVLAVTDKNIERVLELTGLDRYFEVRATAEDAVDTALARAALPPGE